MVGHFFQQGRDLRVKEAQIFQGDVAGDGEIEFLTFLAGHLKAEVATRLGGVVHSIPENASSAN